MLPWPILQRSVLDRLCNILLQIGIVESLLIGSGRRHAVPQIIIQIQASGTYPADPRARLAALCWLLSTSIFSPSLDSLCAIPALSSVSMILTLCGSLAGNQSYILWFAHDIHDDRKCKDHNRSGSDNDALLSGCELIPPFQYFRRYFFYLSAIAALSSYVKYKKV